MAQAQGGPPQITGEAVMTPSGLEYTEIVVGTGAEARAGQKVSVHYTGWLVNGTKFDSSVDRGQPYSFTIRYIICH